MALVRRRLAIDFEASKSLVFARLLQKEDRRGRYKGYSDESLNAVFEKAYPYVEEVASDGDMTRQVVGDGEVPEIESRWKERAKKRWAESWAMKPQAIDPLTMWVIYQIVSILIQLWWERRKQRLGS